MWTKANRVFKDAFPSAHQRLKARWLAPLGLDPGFSLPRRMSGQTIWVHPRLLTAERAESHILEWVLEALRPGDVFFDVGAHYGWIAIPAARRVGLSGTVIAFEPSPVLASILDYHKRVNRLTRLHVVRSAVSDVDSDAVPFYLLNSGLSFRNSLTIGASDTPYVTGDEKIVSQVHSVTLDQFVANSGWIPNLIKIDVEGAELLVLRGMQQTLLRHRPLLILGVHSYWLPRSQTVDQIFKLLQDLDYEIKDQNVIPFDDCHLADYFCRPKC